MRIEVRFQDDVAIMSLNGKFLAGGDGPFLRQKVKDLIEAGAKNMVIDFSGVPYIDSTGLGFLAGSRVTAQNAGVNMVLASVKSALAKARQATASSTAVPVKAAKTSKKKRPATPAD